MSLSLAAARPLILATLPCARCSQPGPHRRIITTIAGGITSYTARCTGCAEPRQLGAKEVAHMDEIGHGLNGRARAALRPSEFPGGFSEA